MAPQRPLSALAQAINGTLHGPDRPIRELSIDSRQPFDPHDTLFIALHGKHHNGHRYIGEMHQRGVRAFLVQQVPADPPTHSSFIEVADTLRALQGLAAWHRKGFTLPVIGITGSNGKTVVKEWLAQLLAPTERVVRSPGSWNSQVGVPLSVWGISGRDTIGIFEAGISEPGEMDTLGPIIAPTIGIFTNIGPAHGAHFTDDAAKAREKAKLFRHAEVVVYCHDQAEVHEALAALPGVKLIGWGRSEGSDLYISAEHNDGATTQLRMRWQGETIVVRLPFTDHASVENALHCITVLLHLGHSPEAITRGVTALQPVSMRLETLPGLNNGTLINDAYSNDLASLTIALLQLSRTAAGRPKVVVLSDIEDSADDPAHNHQRMAALLHAAAVHQLIAIGPAMQQHAALFPNGTRFFPDAGTLLDALPQPPVNGAVTLVKGARHFGLERVVQRWEEHTHGTVMEVDLEAMRHNLNHYRERCGPQVRIMGMVKANGYGTDAVELARFLTHERVAWLGVAYADEGIQLRRQGIRTPVLVMNPEPVPMETLHRYQLQAEVYDQRSLRAAIDFAAHVPDAPAVHLKLDTGMHRLGFTPQELPALLGELRHRPRLQVASIFSHLAASEDPRNDAFTRQQIATFRQLSTTLSEALGYKPLLHIANSAAITRFPEARLDLVRLGIGLHGIGADEAETAQLRPVETLRTVVAQVKEIPAGESISYGRKTVLGEPARVAVLPIGYADGLPSRLGEGRGRVWIAGQEAPILGAVCMDMCMVNVTNIPCAPGDEAIVFSPEHPVQHYAADLGTIPYEALTGISPRVKRVFVRE